MTETVAKRTRPLNPKQEAFIREYAKDLNATQAARRAGYKGKYLDRRAYALVQRCREVIEERKAVVLSQRTSTGIANLEQTLRLVTAKAFGDWRKLFDDHDNCKAPSQLTRREAMGVAGFEVEETFTKVGDHAEHTGYIKKFKLADPAPYAMMLLRFHNAFPDRAKGAIAPKPNETQNLDLLSTDEVETYLALRKKSTVILNGHG